MYRCQSDHLEILELAHGTSGERQPTTHRVAGHQYRVVGRDLGHKLRGLINVLRSRLDVVQGVRAAVAADHPTLRLLEYTFVGKIARGPKVLGYAAHGQNDALRTSVDETA